MSNFNRDSEDRPSPDRSDDDSLFGRPDVPLPSTPQPPEPVPETDGSHSEVTHIVGPEAFLSANQQGGADSSPGTEPMFDEVVDIPRDFGRYRVQRRLGMGGMGAVYLAIDQQLGREVALKIPTIRRDDQQAVERFFREARAMATVQHANLCPVYDVGEFHGQLYLTMAYIKGGTLADELKARGQLPETIAAAFLRKVAIAIHRAHLTGVVHRDLKPANIMLNEDGEPVVMDFGLARLNRAGEAEITQSGAIMGSPAYMAPEQVESQLDRIGPPTDVYAMGVILYQMLCGRRPFEGSTVSVLRQIGVKTPARPQAIRPDVSPELEAICLKAMSPEIESRYPTAEALADALKQFLRQAGGDLDHCSLNWSKPSPQPSDADSVGSATALGSDANSVSLPSTGPTVLLSPARSSGRWRLSIVAVVVTLLLAGVWSAMRPQPPVPFASELASAPVVPPISTAPDEGATEPTTTPTGQPDLKPPKRSLLPPRPVPTVASSGELEDAGQDLFVGNVPSVALADLDGDGDPDAIFVSDGGVGGQIWLNDGHAVFTPTNQTFGKEDYTSVALGDLDGDGDFDVVLAVKTASSQVWLNNSKGQFEQITSLQLPEAVKVELGDIDNDGDLDAVFGTHTQRPIALNDGQGVLTISDQQIGTSTGVLIPSLGDLDGDGDLDLYVPRYQKSLSTSEDPSKGSPSEVWLNDGHGQFHDTGQRLVLDQAQKSSLIILDDVDRDGDVDVFESRIGALYNRLWINDGRGYFKDGADQWRTSRPSAGAIADFDGNRQSDLLLVHPNGGLGLFRNVGMSRTPPKAEWIGVNDVQAFISVGDLDADGDLDAISGGANGESGRVWLNRGLNSKPKFDEPQVFDSVPVLISGSPSTKLLVADFNQDNFVDFCFGSMSGTPTVSIHLNDGLGQFGNTLRVLLSEHIRDAAICDIDGDGDVDIALVTIQSNIKIFANDGDANFSIQQTIKPDGEVFGIGVGDFDSDGDEDLIAGPENTNGKSILLKNSGTGTFSVFPLQLPGLHLGQRVRRIVVEDIDSDGDLDLLPVGSGSFAVNDGFGNFTSSNGELRLFSSLFSAAFGDLDKDGQRDLVLAESFQRHQRIFLGRTNGQFELTTNSGCSFFAAGVALGDVDNDGDLDIVRLSEGIISSRPTTVWFNDGAASFHPRPQFLPAITACDLALADIDGDSDLDLLLAMATPPHQIFFNTTVDAAAKRASEKKKPVGELLPVSVPQSREVAAGEFRLGARFGDAAAVATALGDVDRDGDLDVIVVAAQGGSRIWKNDGKVGFTEGEPIQSEGIGTAVATGDWDGDGDLDVIIGSQDQPGVVWLNDGSGKFKGGASALNAGVRAIATADLDRDGDLDVVTAQQGPALVWFNDGSGKFVAGSSKLGDANEDQRDVAIGDFDADGDFDVLIVRQDKKPGQVWLNDGKGVFTAGKRVISAINPTSVSVADLDEDGDLDALVTTTGGITEMWWNTGRGSFVVGKLPATGMATRATAIADLNGDGHWDWILANDNRYPAFVALSTEAIPQHAPSLIPSDSDRWLGEISASDVAIGDLDGDGDLDLLITTTDGSGQQVWIQEAPTAETQRRDTLFQLTQTLTESTMGFRLAAVDVEQDGDIDVVTFGYAKQPHRIYLNAGDGKLTLKDSLPSEDSQSGVAADFNGDGHIDLLEAGLIAKSSRLFLNDGKGSFALSPQSFDARNLADVLVHDFNRDGLPDLFLNSTVGSSHVWLNRHPKRFEKAPDGLPKADHGRLCVGDFNGDGHADLVVAPKHVPLIPGSETVLWLGDGSGNLKAGPRISADRVTLPLTGDFDRDGDLDLYLLSQAEDSLWLNDGKGEFTRSPQKLDALSSWSGVVGDVDGDGDLDVIVGNMGTQPNSVWLNDGQAHFTRHPQWLGHSPTFDMALADLDKDGDLDLVSGDSAGSPVTIWLNKSK